jgi:hypothetical protein
MPCVDWPINQGRLRMGMGDSALTTKSRSLWQTRTSLVKAFGVV